MISIKKEELVEKYGLLISRLSRRMIRNKELAKEAAQEVWFEVIKSLDTFKGDSELSTWIYTITRRTILRYIKNERVYKCHEYDLHFEREPIDFSGNESEKLEWVKEQCDYCLTAFCHCLNNNARLIFLFRDLAGLEFSQIGLIMETSEVNIRKISSRSKEKVRNFMNNDCVLYNPKGKCRCRIKKQIHSINFEKTYDQLYRTSKLIDFYLKFDTELPVKNYWLNFIEDVVTE